MDRAPNRPPGIDPRDVQSRRDLARYLDQSLLGDYVMLTEADEFTQVSTFVKSYLIEAHRDSNQELARSLRPIFPEVRTLADPSMMLAIDKKNNAYFADVLDQRFIVLHSIANTSDTDFTISKLVDGSTQGFDRAWMPTEFLLAAQRGQMTGFKFGFERFVQGLWDSETDLLPSTTRNDSTRRARFRLAVSEDVTAERDYAEIQSASVFSGRKALDHIQFSAKVNDDGKKGYISNRVYADGKIIGNGTSIGSHLITVESVLSLYSALISRIEKHSMLWSKTNSGYIQLYFLTTSRFPACPTLSSQSFVPPNHFGYSASRIALLMIALTLRWWTCIRVIP
jgi:hypothetical protein